MRVPLSWLREHVAVDLAPSALAERLTLLGMEVRAIERWGGDWRNVVVGELLTVDKHPRADRLSLTTVTVGAGEPLEIVCGATNIAVGQRVPVALPGAVLPGDRRIERTEKMGIVSNGMLCSGEELGMTLDGEGILILDSGAPLGAAIDELYGDTVLDVDVKPNRGDALSIVGLAREVAAATGSSLTWPEVVPAESGRPTSERISVEIREPGLCPRFVGRWVSGLTVGPSPDRVQMRLLAAGMRPVSNVVDASNYVMLELGKPIHTFDAGRIHAGRIVVRLAEAGERLTTLDHVDRPLDPETLLIADPAGPLAIAGIMGGAASEVSEATAEVLIESAIFDAVNIRRTGQRYGLRSEASLRFEKGQELRLARIGADRCAVLLAAWAGGTVAPGRLDSAPDEPQAGRLPFRPSRLGRLLGVDVPLDEQRAVLARAGIVTEPARPGTLIPIAGGGEPISVGPGDAEVLVAIVPTWRRDLAIEADLAEEVARIRGYELVPASLPDSPLPPWRPSPLEVRDAVRETLAGAGYTEVVTHALVAVSDIVRFAWAGAAVEVAGEGSAGGSPIRVTNPLSREHAVLRQGLVGSLVDVVSTNRRRGTPDVAVFEVGKGYGRVAEEPREWWRLGLALTGAAEERAWNRPARAADFSDAQGAIELVARRLGFGTLEFEPLHDDVVLHPGRAATVVARVGKEVRLFGRVGELHPAIAAQYELGQDRLIVAELAVHGLSGGSLVTVRAVAPSRFPAIERDLAVVVPVERHSADVERTIRAAAGPLLLDVRLFDVYRGAPLGANERSLAFRLSFGSSVRTLTEGEVEEAVGAVTSAIADRLGGRLRT